MAYEMSLSFAASMAMSSGSKTAYDLNAAFTMNSSGTKAVFYRFVSPVSLSSGTVVAYFFVSGGLGSPTDVRAAVWSACQAGEDIDNPNTGGAAIATSGAVDCSAFVSTPGWATFTITGVSMTAGLAYYVILDNRTGTPASHYPSVVYRAAACFHSMSNADNSTYLFQSGYTGDGFTAAAPTISSNAAGVVKIGSAIFGNPWVDAGGAHASNANDRGNRYTFKEDVVVSGIVGIADTNLSGFEINNASSGANLVTAGVATGDIYRQQKGGVCRFSPVTLSAGVAYDVVMTAGASDTFGTIYYMGEASPPADVAACRCVNIGYVDGDTPGSYTLDTTKVMRMNLIIDDMPLIDTPTVGNVTEDDTVRGGAGTFAVPAEADVENGVQYGAGGTEFTGTLTGGGGSVDLPEPIMIGA